MRKIVLCIVMGIFLCSCGGKSDYGFVSIKGEEVIAMMAKKSSFVVMLTNDNCYACETFKEEAKAILEKNKLIIYELNCKDMDDNLKDQLNIALGSYSTWPTLFNVVEGETPIVNQYEYSLNPEGWKLWMKDMSLIQS